MGKRVEEGLAILVKNNLFEQLKRDISTRNIQNKDSDNNDNNSYDNVDNLSLHSLYVSNTQTLFLPRNFEDSRF